MTSTSCTHACVCVCVCVGQQVIGRWCGQAAAGPRHGPAHPPSRPPALPTPRLPGCTQAAAAPPRRPRQPPPNIPPHTTHAAPMQLSLSLTHTHPPTHTRPPTHTGPAAHLRRVERHKGWVQHLAHRHQPVGNAHAQQRGAEAYAKQLEAWGGGGGAMCGGRGVWCAWAVRGCGLWVAQLAVKAGKRSRGRGRGGVAGPPHPTGRPTPGPPAHQHTTAGSRAAGLAALTVARHRPRALAQREGRVAGRHLLEGVVGAARKHLGQRAEGGGGGGPAGGARACVVVVCV